VPYSELKVPAKLTVALELPVNPVIILVLAMSDRAAYLGVDTEDDFCVFTIRGQSDTRIRDMLLYRPHDFSGCAVNRTSGDSLSIDFECNTGSLSEAISLLVQLRQPESIVTSRGTYPANSPNLTSRIRDGLFL